MSLGSEVDPLKLCQHSVEETYRLLETRRTGLTSAEAQERLETFGANVLQEVAGVPLWRKAITHLFNTFAILLWVAAILSFLSDMAPLAVAIIFVILINAVFAFFQEYRAEKAIEALKEMLPPKARVVRDGKPQEIDARDIVPGDIMLIEEGDAVSADSRLIYAADLRVDNASLTGEVDPVPRRAEELCVDAASVTDVPSLIFTGTSAVLGSGRAVVYATGMKTEFGKIAGLTQSVGPQLSPLQRNVAKLSRLISIIAVAIGVVFFFLSFFVLKQTWVAAAVLAIGIIVANVPEGLLPTLTMSLSVATQRMAKRHVLVKKLSSVETLGSTTVICTDKTGTLTANQMTVKEVWLPSGFVQVEGVGYDPTGEMLDPTGSPLADAQHRLLDEVLLGGTLCSNARLLSPDGDNARWHILGDPTEAAMVVAAAKNDQKPDEINRQFRREFEHPFDSARKRMSVIVRRDGELVAYVKGAPKELIESCTHIRTLDGVREITDAERAEALEANDRFARDALRVIGVACRSVAEGEDFRDLAGVEQKLTLLGLEAMQDPPRPEVSVAVEEAQGAGIRIVMITGDYGLTAEAIARKIGIVHGEQPRIVTGRDLETMADAELREALAEEVVFARVIPEHKMRIAQTLQAMGEIVAMTGDGVNDAPALKAADIGVAMGMAGTDVAREAADMILTDDNFASIVAAVEEGRAIFDNIRRFLTYFQTSNVAEMVPFFFTIFLGVPLPLTLMQILTIDLLTDQVPALALGLERPEPGVMQRPPRPKGEPILTLGMVLKAYLFLGPLAAAVGMAGFYYFYIKAGWHPGIPMQQIGPEPNSYVYMAATTMTLTGIVMAQVGNGFAMRTHRESIFRVGFFTNKLLLWGIAAELVLQAVIVYVPWANEIFSTRPISGTDWLFLAAFAPLLLVADEIRKLVLRTMERRKPVMQAATGQGPSTSVQASTTE